ncbi:acyl-CoA thioesterase [Microbulbifer sp. S227A]|uniref:acyl-CoA thioesterase n=1 Tax=Microbulbifer sp. S227A TaxID=3415131 RepID=UPI003C7AAD91
MITATVRIMAQFYDLDPMNIVWHGNYLRFFEQARCALLDRIGYNYDEMHASGYHWPIVDARLKYVRSVAFQQEIDVTATLVEYEHRLKINYLARDVQTGAKTTTGTTIQVAVARDSGEMCFVSPAVLTEKLARLL